MALASMTAADWKSSLDFSMREVFKEKRKLFLIALPYNLTGRSSVKCMTRSGKKMLTT